MTVTVTAYDPDCIFCKIIAGEVETTFVAESDRAVAFNDMSPQAPTHILVVPRDHVTGLRDLEDPGTLADLMLLARNIAQEAGLHATGYRVLTNDGEGAGQSVWHMHLHVIGGRKLSGKMG